MEISEFSQDEIPIDRISGLRPELRLCVGAGYSREDVKSFVLSQNKGLIGDAITSLEEIALQLTGILPERVLGPFSRQEVIRMLLTEPQILKKMPELKRIRRQRHFLRRLDSALQSGRMTFAHGEEEEVYHERLNQALGQSPLRDEIRAFARAYETWLEAMSWMDLPLLIRSAIRILNEGWPSSVPRPQEIWRLSVETPESLEREFWEVLGHHIEVKWVKTLKSFSNSVSNKDPASQKERLNWQKWHTLDDAVEYLADELISKEGELRRGKSGEQSGEQSLEQFWKDQAILMPDIPSVRRSLKRALDLRGIPQAELRDPTSLRTDETVKWAMLPLEVVAGNYERRKVISWLRSFQMQDEFPNWVSEINSRGIRHGLLSYSGGILSGVHSRLAELDQQLGGRQTCEEISKKHLEILRASIRSFSSKYEFIPFFENFWKSLVTDISRVGLEKKKAPLLFWMERVELRLRESSPPVGRLKPKTGVKIYRLQQAPVQQVKKIWILGLPSHWFSGEGSGSYWLTERDREILSSEFSVRSSNQVREERLTTLTAWLSGAQERVILDAQYGPEGKERESILPLVRELELSLGISEVSFPDEKGAHPRFNPSYGLSYGPSYGMPRSVQPQEVQLLPLPSLPGRNGPELTATALDRYSRCSFQALSYHRWNLRDIREPDTELWPEVRGNILHESVRLLLESFHQEGRFSVLPSEALERAWKTKRPKGLIRSARVEKYVKSRMVRVLEVFCEKEREYLSRSGAKPISLENLSFKIEYPDFTVLGQPDRIDEHPEGYFILDYKTSGVVPHGTDMVKWGYRLQLPFYALAVQQKMDRPVLGVQFVELDRKGGRKSGIFFQEFNGKENGKLTQVRSSSKSLVPLPPQDVWDQLEDHLVKDARAFIQGRFQARPKIFGSSQSECQRCHLADLCGRRRNIDVQETEDSCDE